MSDITRDIRVYPKNIYVRTVRSLNFTHTKATKKIEPVEKERARVEEDVFFEWWIV